MNAIRPSTPKWLGVDEIDFPTTSRAYNATDVSALANSIRAIGLMSPLTVVERDCRYLLAAATGETVKDTAHAKQIVAEDGMIRVTYGQLGMENAPKALARIILAETAREALGHNEAED
jgi:hypothetical protein